MNLEMMKVIQVIVVILSRRSAHLHVMFVNTLGRLKFAFFQVETAAFNLGIVG